MKRFTKKIISKLIKYLSKSEAYVYKKILREKYVSFHNNWSSQWKNFYYQNYNNIQELLFNLKRDLLPHDHFLIELICERYFKIIVEQVYHDSVLYSEKILFNSDEIAERNHVEHYMKRVTKKITLANNHYEVPVFYYENGLIYITDLIDVTYLTNTIFIDGGAYNGDSAVVFSKYTPKMILMFEPSEINCQLINETFKLNPHLKNICVVYQFGLGSDDSTVNFYYEGSASKVITIGSSNLPNQQVKIIKLDDFLKDVDTRIGLIKLDIEGFEYEAVIGSLNLIRKNRPILLISIYHTPKDFFYIKPLLEASVRDYNFLIRKLNPYHPTYETTLICWPKEISKT